MSQQIEEILTCPACGAHQRFVRCPSVNATIDPALKEALLEHRLTMFTCDRCGTGMRVAYNLLYHDMKRKLLVWLRFPDERGSIEIEPAAREAWESLASDYTYRIVTSADDLLEKVLVFDDGYNDRDIETFKFLVSTAEGLDLKEPLYYLETKRPFLGRRRLVLRRVPPVGEFVDREYSVEQFSKAKELSAKFITNPEANEVRWPIVDRDYVLRRLELGGALKR